MVEFRLIRDHEAHTEISGLYGDIRDTLRLPWTPTLFQALAVWPDYLELAWTTIKRAVATDEFRSDAFSMREIAESNMQKHHAIKRTLSDADSAGLSREALDEVRGVLHAFRYGNPKLDIIAQALWCSLRGQPVGNPAPSNRADWTNEEKYLSSLALEPVEEVDERTVGLFADIKSVLNAPFIDDDYRALARWPSFLEMAWLDLKPNLAQEWYIKGASEIRGLSRSLAMNLTTEIGLDWRRLASAGITQEDQKDIDRILESFAQSLPRSILNLSDFYLTLNDIVESDMGLRTA